MQNTVAYFSVWPTLMHCNVILNAASPAACHRYVVSSESDSRVNVPRATRYTLQQNRPTAIVMKILFFKINKEPLSCGNAFDPFLRVLEMEQVLTTALINKWSMTEDDNNF